MSDRLRGRRPASNETPMQSAQGVDDPRVSTLIAQLQTAVNTLTARVSELERRPQATVEESRQVLAILQAKVETISFGQPAPLGQKTTPGTSGQSARANHQHACVAYVVDTLAELPEYQTYFEPATAYVRHENKYYMWLGQWREVSLYGHDHPELYPQDKFKIVRTEMEMFGLHVSPPCFAYVYATDAYYAFCASGWVPLTNWFSSSNGQWEE